MEMSCRSLPARMWIKKGDQVVAAGFPLFSERDLPYLLPTITRGVVSHVAGGGSAILHTTCCVQSGASGGAVLRLGDGLPLRLVALVACNIQEQGSGALFPHVNLAVPATVMAAPLAGYRATRDVKFLHALESKDPNVQRLWKLQPLTSKL
uniref:Peroxisomal leader peptide-processing protease n=1 Tax=Timema bartmani TaxID=61472 RepID=A0A7R9F5Y7_9NEOP|nr:unnamed protein product [Timema bartmani]